MSVNPKLLNYSSPAPNQPSCFFNSWKQRPLRVACVRSGEAWDHFLMRHQVPLGTLSPEWAGGSLESPGNWLQGNREAVDAGGLIPLHSRDPFPAPPTKARGPGYWHMPLSPWILQSEKIRSESQNLFPRENRLSKSWYYWCWGKLRGACNLFNKSRTVFAGAPEFSCFLRSILRGWECPLWSTRMFDQLCVFSRAAQTIRKASALWSSPELFSLNSLFPSEFIINDIITSLFLLWLSTFLTNGDLPLGSRRRLWAPAALPLQSWTASPPVPGIRLASVFLWHVPDLRAMADPTSSQGRKKFLGQSKVEFQRMMASCTECGLFPWIIIGSIPFPSLDLLSMYDCFNSLLRNKHLIRPLLPSYSENRKEGLDR